MELNLTTFKLFLLQILFLLLVSCNKKETDECLKTKWSDTKTYEIKLAVNIRDTDPMLPGGSPGSSSPAHFKNMVVGGTIEMVFCDESSFGPVNIGNSYIIKGEDIPADIYEPDAWWIGHVVYVYEFGNSSDFLDINLNVKITMEDGNSYTCTVSKQAFSNNIEKMAGDMFHFILIDVSSNNWIKL